MVDVGTPVVIRITRCACVGGGHSEEMGNVIQIVTTPNGMKWYKVSHPNGISTVKETDIIKVLT